MRRLFVLAMTLMMGGCVSSPHERTSLDPSQIDNLRRLARPPESLAISLHENPDGSVTLTRAMKLTGAPQTELPLLTRPLRKTDTPMVRVDINDKTIYAVVDTGSSTTLIDYWGATRTGVTPIGPDLISRAVFSLGGTTELFLGLVNEMRLGDIRIHRLPIGILNVPQGRAAQAWTEGFRTEMILGHDLLGSFSYVQFDLAKERITVGRLGRYTPRTDKLAGEAALSTRFGVPTIVGHIDGRGPVDIALDSGLDGGLWIPRPLGNRLNFPELQTTSGVRAGQALTGKAVYKNIHPCTIDVLDFRLNKVPAMAGLINAGKNDPPYVLLGRYIFQRYVITLDYVARKVYFERP